MVRTHKLKSFGWLITLHPFLMVIVPDRTLHTLIHSNEAVMSVKHNAYDGGGMMLKELTKLMDFHFIIKLLVFNFDEIFLFQGERRLVSIFYLRQHGGVDSMVGLLIFYPVQIHIVFQDLSFFESKHNA